MRNLILFFSCLFFSNVLFAQVDAIGGGNFDEKKKEKITVISISDTSQLPPGAKIVRYTPPSTGMDSSRFVKRTIKDERNVPEKIKGISVDKSVFGKHTDYITDYVTNYHRNYAAKLTRIKDQHRSHFSFIENVFGKYNIPKELKALAVIESAMKFEALSPVGARGPWQFMPETGRLLGLRVDNRVDERTDFYKSTKAAAKYLSKLCAMFDNDWLLAVAAYNWGPGNIIKQINRNPGKSFWDIKDNLPRETRNHVMAFIATASYLDPKSNLLEMGNYPKEAKAPRANFGAFASAFNDNPMVEDNVISFKADQPKIAPAEIDNIAILKVKGYYQITIIAKILDFDLNTLQRWNPKFDTEIVGAENSIYLRIPIAKLDKFIMDKEQIVIESRKMIENYKRSN